MGLKSLKSFWYSVMMSDRSVKLVGKFKKVWLDNFRWPTISSSEVVEKIGIPLHIGKQKKSYFEWRNDGPYIMCILQDSLLLVYSCKSEIWCDLVKGLLVATISHYYHFTLPIQPMVCTERGQIRPWYWEIHALVVSKRYCGWRWRRRRQGQWLKVPVQWCNHLNTASMILPLILRSQLVIWPEFEPTTSYAPSIVNSYYLQSC